MCKETKEKTFEEQVMERVVRKRKKESNGNIYGYDFDNNLIYYRGVSGYENWKEYDENGNLIHCKYSSGFEYWNEYDSNGNLIHYKDSDEYEFYYNSDDKNSLKLYEIYLIGFIAFLIIYIISCLYIYL